MLRPGLGPEPGPGLGLEVGLGLGFEGRGVWPLHAAFRSARIAAPGDGAHGGLFGLGIKPGPGWG